MTSLSKPVRVAPTGHPAYSQTFLCEPSTAAIGRKLVRDALGVWHLDDLADVAALIMSELIANAVRHTHCHSIRLMVGRPGVTRVRVGVVDRAPSRLPVLGPVGDDGESGRGLLLIDGIADRWGYDLRGPDRRPWGKEVWAEIDTEPQMSTSTHSSLPAMAMTPKQAAFVRFADHCIVCRTCRAMDDDGANLNLPCAEQDRLREEYRQADRPAGRGGGR